MLPWIPAVVAGIVFTLFGGRAVRVVYDLARVGPCALLNIGCSNILSPPSAGQNGPSPSVIDEVLFSADTTTVGSSRTVLIPTSVIFSDVRPTRTLTPLAHQTRLRRTAGLAHEPMISSSLIVRAPPAEPSRRAIFASLLHSLRSQLGRTLLMCQPLVIYLSWSIALVLTAACVVGAAVYAGLFVHDRFLRQEETLAEIHRKGFQVEKRRLQADAAELEARHRARDATDCELAEATRARQAHLQADLDLSRQANYDLQKRIQNFAEASMTTASTIHLLNARVENREQQIEQYRDNGRFELEALQRDLLVKEKQLTQRRVTEEQLEKRIEGKVKRYEGRRASFKIEGLENENAALKAFRTKAEREHPALQSRVHDLEADAEVARSSAEQRTRELDAEIATLKADKSSMRETILDLRQEVQSAQEKAKKQKAKNGSRVDKLKKKLREARPGRFSMEGHDWDSDSDSEDDDQKPAPQARKLAFSSVVTAIDQPPEIPLPSILITPAATEWPSMRSTSTQTSFPADLPSAKVSTPASKPAADTLLSATRGTPHASSAVLQPAATALSAALPTPSTSSVAPSAVSQPAAAALSAALPTPRTSSAVPSVHTATSSSSSPNTSQANPLETPLGADRSSKVTHPAQSDGQPSSSTNLALNLAFAEADQSINAARLAEILASVTSKKNRTEKPAKAAGEVSELSGSLSEKPISLVATAPMRSQNEPAEPAQTSTIHIGSAENVATGQSTAGEENERVDVTDVASFPSIVAQASPAGNLAFQAMIDALSSVDQPSSEVADVPDATSGGKPNAFLDETEENVEASTNRELGRFTADGARLSAVNALPSRDQPALEVEEAPEAASDGDLDSLFGDTELDIEELTDRELRRLAAEEQQCSPPDVSSEFEPFDAPEPGVNNGTAPQAPMVQAGSTTATELPDTMAVDVPHTSTHKPAMDVTRDTPSQDKETTEMDVDVDERVESEPMDVTMGEGNAA